VKTQIIATSLNITLNETCHVRSHINLLLKVFSLTSDTHFLIVQIYLYIYHNSPRDSTAYYISLDMQYKLSLLLSASFHLDPLT